MFDPSIIFHRTQAGRDEIQQKSHGLTQSERLVLIMVDGASTFQQVRSKLPVLTDDRFARAVQKLQAKELILEVFLPVEGQAPEEIERTVIDRFLQQDPLDPVTIIMRDPEEELEFLARFSVTPKPQPASVPGPTPSIPQAPVSTSVTPQTSESASEKGGDDEELHTEMIDLLASELKERQQARPARTESAAAFERRSDTHAPARGSRHRAHEDAQPKRAAPHWGYWMIALGCAFIAGYVLARIGS
ncbi:MAG TPA: hypothetical protein VGE12_22525 [Noviherbaspirillum sp.]